MERQISIRIKYTTSNPSFIREELSKKQNSLSELFRFILTLSKNISGFTLAEIGKEEN
jgi:hypothetical protein